MRPLDQVMLEMKGCAITGGLADAPIEKLKEYAAALCHAGAYTHLGAHEFPQIADTVRINLLRAHIEALHGHITTLNTENGKTQRRVVALTIMALVAGGAQAITAILPYVGIVPTPPTVAAQQTPVTKQSTPTPETPPKLDQLDAKKPSK